MLRWIAVLAMVAGGAPPLAAQSEAALKEFFEGRTVAPKLALPGTEHGVDIYPGAERPLDYSRYADRLKDNGTAIRSGESVVVTKVRVKPKHIEFQLGGGGYGTFGDETSSNVATAAAPKTKREKNLEAEIKREQDPAKKRAMREELDDLKAERERENARNRSNVAEAEEHRKQNIRQRRLEGGSRFNIRYRDQVPAGALNPGAVMAALEKYLDFGELRPQAATPTDPNRVAPTTTAPQPGRTGSPRKGMLAQEVDALLGPPVSTKERREGSLRVQTREYSAPDGRITGEFVEGVLIRYTITSE